MRCGNVFEAMWFDGLPLRLPQVWIRRKDYHILTGGKANYITDQRFQVLFNHANQDWSLQIKFVTLSDNGTYECQVGRCAVGSLLVASC